MELKEKIKQLRKENNLTQKDLAKRLDVAPTTVSTWERGSNRPLMDKIVIMSISDTKIIYNAKKG